MRRSLIKQMTRDDIREILDVAKSLSSECEPSEESVLRALVEKNNCISTIGERYPEVLRQAELSIGRKLSGERCRDNTTIREFVVYRLRKEGYGYSEIGRMIQREHSTVMHLYRKMCDILSVPFAYKEIVSAFRGFDESLGQPRQCPQPSSQTTSASALAESPAK